MADKTKIEWADATVNAVNGCSVVSPGCANCYAMRLAGTRMKHHPSRAGLTVDSKAGPVWNGEVRLSETALLQPLAWKRPRRIFWNAHGDLFHDAVPDEWIDRVFAVCALTPQHTHMILTKRSARMRAHLSKGLLSSFIASRVSAINPNFDFRGWRWPLPNVWLGVSVEDQARADERLPDLLATPAAVRFLSCEPLLSDLDLEDVRFPNGDGDYYGVNALTGSGHRADEDGNTDADPCEYPSIDWVIVGGESGPGARPMHPDWARSIRDQCADAGVPFHFKQWGDWAPSLDRDNDDPDWRADYSNEFVDTGKSRWLNLAGGCGFHGDRFHVMRRIGKKAAGRLLDGIEHNGLPGGC